MVSDIYCRVYPGPRMNLMNTADDVSVDTINIAADLRISNFGRNGNLEFCKFDVYFAAMYDVVEMEGSGTHERRHTQVG